MAGLVVKGILGKYGKQYAGDAGGGNGGGLFSRLGKSSGRLFSRFGGGGGSGGGANIGGRSVNIGGNGGGANAVGSVNTVGNAGGANAGPTLTNRIKAYKPSNMHIGISVAVAVIVIVLIIVLSVVLTRTKTPVTTTTPIPMMSVQPMGMLMPQPATLPSATLPASTVLPSISPTTLAPTPGVAMAPQTAAVQSQTINVSPPTFSPTTSEPFPINLFQITSGRSVVWQGPSIPITAGQPYNIQTSVFLWNNATSSIDTTTPFVVTLAYTPPGGSVQYTWLMPNQKSGMITITGSCPASSSQPIIYIDTVPIGIDIIVSQYNNNNTSSTSPWVPSGCQLGSISSTMGTAIQTWASQNKIR